MRGQSPFWYIFKTNIDIYNSNIYTIICILATTWLPFHFQSRLLPVTMNYDGKQNALLPVVLIFGHPFVHTFWSVFVHTFGNIFVHTFCSICVHTCCSICVHTFGPSCVLTLSQVAESKFADMLILHTNCM